MAIPAIDLSQVAARRPALGPVLEHPALVRLGSQEAVPRPADPWSLGDLQGRLVELSPGPRPAVLSVAVDLVRQAQLVGEPTAWVTVGPDVVYAPDVAACGVDLAALPVVRTDEPAAAGRAADLLLRSGAFGLVVVDLGRQARLTPPQQSRLVQLALKHDAAVVCLTQTPPMAPSLGSLVSLRAAVSRRRAGPGRHVCRVSALKDKRQGPGWRWEGVWRGADGLA
ncbi:MAG: recombinase A [Candidatus Krumholzibacteriia bacterium]